MGKEVFWTGVRSGDKRIGIRKFGNGVYSFVVDYILYGMIEGRDR